jgi:hypothetical protein
MRPSASFALLPLTGAWARHGSNHPSILPAQGEAMAPSETKKVAIIGKDAFECLDCLAVQPS